MGILLGRYALARRFSHGGALFYSLSYVWLLILLERVRGVLRMMSIPLLVCMGSGSWRFPSFDDKERIGHIYLLPVYLPA